MATTAEAQYNNPVKLDIEDLTGAIIAGVIIGIVKKFTNQNALVELGIGAFMFLFSPLSLRAGFLKLAGLALLADGFYSLLKNNFKVTETS